ncbi:hypothetical protein F503_01451 [Ophiostoma piceae UAMH 11346]|uniref:Uncharacterized protein n=1 Tax=Ophiostoma piceae (strain UAMH 11346) TaxID=1262450 RepID=S3BV82_OPHP1|nr:hypothetical protein F503_01451 [Ophiostoma piceae UAMH 11346]
MPQSHVPTYDELFRKIRDIRRRHDRYTHDLEVIKRNHATVEHNLHEARSKLERELAIGRSAARKRIRDKLESTIRDCEESLRNSRPNQQIQRLESSIRMCERDATVVRRFTVNRRLLNRLVPQELADEIAAFDYRRRYPIIYDDDE